MKEAWMCPFCKVVYAPFMPSCECQTFKVQQPILTQPIVINEHCLHVWDENSTAPACKNCGTSKPMLRWTTTITGGCLV